MIYKLGCKPFKHTVQSAKRFGIGFQLLDLLAAPPLNGTPWGAMTEKVTGDSAWGGILGNDNYGDCVIADNLRKVSTWNALAKNKIVPITADDALALYGAETGFTASDPNTDQGTDPIANANYLEQTGWTDDNGVLHKIDAWVPIDPTNDNHLKNALNLLGPVSLCIDFPDFAMTQFDAGEPWDYTGQSYAIQGGHDILAVQYEREVFGGYIHDTKSVISWGRRFPGTHRFWARFLTGAIAWISLDFVAANGNLPSNINLDQAVADLKALGASE